MTNETLEPLGQAIAGALPGAVSGYAVTNGELVVTANAADIVRVVTFLRDDPGCAFFSFIDVTAVDWPQRERRFDIVYHLLSPWLNQRIRVRIRTNAENPVDSVVGVFPAANWFEREAYDLYGILFEGHPDLRRLLTDYGFEGHPLRKDFPLTGFVELHYDDQLKRVVYEPVKLMQDYRSFDFLSPWEGMGAAIPGDEKAGEAKPRDEKP